MVKDLIKTVSLRARHVMLRRLFAAIRRLNRFAPSAFSSEVDTGSREENALFK
jgi:hypothetical protein